MPGYWLVHRENGVLFPVHESELRRVEKETTEALGHGVKEGVV